MLETVTLKIPELFYKRFEYTAQATQRSLDEVILHALSGVPLTIDHIHPRAKGGATTFF
ncbi:MAG: hypothetical protein KJ063_17690 [Anaerolineae bacterium]|nr:hypothetical protein [Anaerolineae bacterium]